MTSAISNSHSARTVQVGLILAGLLVLYLPTYLRLAAGPWTNPQEAHGPFIIAIAIGAAFARRAAFFQFSAPQSALGLLVVSFGVALYAVGRSQELLVIETASQLPVVAGALLCLGGWPLLRRLWFAVLFLAFTVIWPSWVIDAITLPLKQGATNLTVETLYAIGYPIASTGVVIAIGSYYLLVADACSGLNSIISLLSVGVLYLYMMGRRPLWRNMALLIAMPFIAFGVNVLRVMVLSLITYHWGEAAGQGFLHDFTGVFLFAAALGGVFVFDGVSGVAHSLVGRPMRWEAWGR